jgi:Pectate lyase superfamily protein
MRQLRMLLVVQLLNALAGCHNTKSARSPAAAPVSVQDPRLQVQAACARCGDVFNVKGFGAKGDGSDDTAAVREAISAAAAQGALPASVGYGGFGQGGIVFFPRGIYVVKEELDAGPGVTIVGSGRQTTEIIVRHRDATSDGIAWKSSKQYGFGGGLRDISIVTDAYVRDLVSVVNWGNFEIANVSLMGGGRYGLNLSDGISITVRNTLVGHAVSAGVWVGDTTGSVTTSTQFFGCYFTNNTNGPGADVAGLGITFVATVFEDNGANDSTNGAGIRVRSGEVTLISPYFENNAGWHMWLGSDQSAHARVTVVEPTMLNGPYTTKEHGGILADRVTGGAFIGGDFSRTSPNAIQFTPAAHGIAVLGAELGPNIPSYNPGGGQSITEYPGVVQYTDPVTGNVRIAGRFTTQLAGDPAQVTIEKGMAGTATWTGGDVAAASACVIPVSVATAAIGDQVLVTSAPSWTDGLIVSGAVSAPGVVHVTMSNATRSVIRVPPINLKVVVLRLQ